MEGYHRCLGRYFGGKTLARGGLICDWRGGKRRVAVLVNRLEGGECRGYGWLGTERYGFGRLVGRLPWGFFF